MLLMLYTVVVNKITKRSAVEMPAIVCSEDIVVEILEKHLKFFFFYSVQNLLVLQFIGFLLIPSPDYTCIRISRFGGISLP